MSGAGRGRGRGRGMLRSDSPKPGDKSDEGNTPTTAGVGIDINQVSILVQTLSLEADDISKDMVSNAVMKYADTETHNEEILRVLYIKILQDWRYAKHMAYICSKLVIIPKLGVAFRTSLVRRIQSDFNNRETDREEKPRTFLACMAFLCQVLHQLRNADGAPFRPLAIPVYRGLEMLLDSKASDKEVEVAVTQLFDVGPLLHKLESSEMRKLMKTIRGKILDTTGTRENREMLLRLLETYAGGWKPPTEDEEATSNNSPKHTPSAKGDTPGDSKKESPKHSSPKRVSFKDTTEVTTISSSGSDSAATYTTAVSDDYPDDFGGVWENPPTDNGNTKRFSYNWSSPPVTPEKNDNDAGQWEYPTSTHDNWDK